MVFYRATLTCDLIVSIATFVITFLNIMVVTVSTGPICPKPPAAALKPIFFWSKAKHWHHIFIICAFVIYSVILFFLTATSLENIIRNSCTLPLFFSSRIWVWLSFIFASMASRKHDCIGLWFSVLGSLLSPCAEVKPQNNSNTKSKPGKFIFVSRFLSFLKCEAALRAFG